VRINGFIAPAYITNRLWLYNAAHTVGSPQLCFYPAR
jgi:hypothetical protein